MNTLGKTNPARGRQLQIPLRPSHLNGPRPVVINYDGWREFVDVHDQGYLLRKLAWRKRIAAKHPDSKQFKSADPNVILARKHEYDQCHCGGLKRNISAQCNRCVEGRRGTGKFVAIKEQFEEFLEEEHQWYEERGLLPPDSKGWFKRDRKPTAQPTQQVPLLLSGSRRSEDLEQAQG